MADPASTPAARPWARIALGGSALLLLPLILALVVLAAKFNGLGINLAMEHAQIARNVAQGQGLSTGSVRPLSLALHHDLKKHPDLYHAPAHPILLGAVFAATHPSDRVAAAFGLLLWVASVLLTFWVAYRWFGPGVATLATAFYGCNVAMLKASLLGMPYPLCAILVLLYAAVAAPKPGEPAPEGGADLRIAGAGLLAGLAAMSHYLLFFFAPVVALHLVASRRRRGRALAVFAIGFLVVVLPWIIRNLVWARSPFFSFYWYEALAGTDDYPGDVVWRSMAAASTGPWEFAFLHPIQMARKIFGGLIRVWQESLSITDPVVAFLFAAALIRGRERGAAWHGWCLAAAAGMVLTVAISCAFRAEPELLLAWTPLLAIPAAAQLASWLAGRAEEVSLRRTWSFGMIAALFREPAVLRATLRRAPVLVVLAVVAFPLFHYVWIFRAEPSVAFPDAAALQQSIPPQATVMTDQPALVAWRGQRRAIWLCLEDKEWDAIEARSGPIDATYVSPSVTSLLPSAKAGWWWWISSPRGIYRDLAPVEAARLPGVLRLRSKG